MPVTVRTGQSNICVAYRFNFPNGQHFTVAAVPLDVETARSVLGNVTEDYSLVVPIHPLGFTWPFLAGMQQTPQYVGEHTQLTGNMLILLTMMIPKLATIPPADDLLAIAEEWYQALLSSGGG